MFSCSIFFIFSALSLLSMSYKKHYAQLFNKDPKVNRKKSLILCGYVILLASVCLSIEELGYSLGLTYFFAGASLMIVFIALVLTYAKKILLPLTILSLLTGLFLSLTLI